MWTKLLLSSLMVESLFCSDTEFNSSEISERDYFLFHPYASLVDGRDLKNSNIGIPERRTPQTLKVLPTSNQDVLPSANNSEECEPNHCGSPTECTSRGERGCFCWRARGNHTTFTYTIELLDEDSAIRLLISEVGHPNGALYATVALTGADGVSLEWGPERAAGAAYISRGPRLAVRIVVPPDRRRNILFQYQELKFEIQKQSSCEESGEIRPELMDGRYTTNRVTVYQLAAPPRRNDSGGVAMTLWHLDVDEALGECLLIGAGRTPFEGPPATLVTGQKRRPKEYFVAAGDVYVAFVARASNRNSTGFRLTWIRNGTGIFDPQDVADDAVPDSVLQSLAICIYNASYVQEFYDRKNPNDIFPSLREKLSQIANRYAAEKGLRLSAAVRKSSVQLSRISRVLPPRPQLPEGVVAVMVTIVQRFDETKAIFSDWQLREVLRRLDLWDAESRHSLLGTKVGQCPLLVDYTSWRIGVYILMPTLCLLFFAFWATRYSSLWRTPWFEKWSRRRHVDATRLEKERSSAPPTIRVSTDDANSYCRVKPLSDDDSDIEIFNKLQKTGRRRSERHPVLRVEGSCNRLWQSSNIAKMMGAEAENVYDSQASIVTIKQFEHDSVTKL